MTQPNAVPVSVLDEIEAVIRFDNPFNYSPEQKAQLNRERLHKICEIVERARAAVPPVSHGGGETEADEVHELWSNAVVLLCHDIGVDPKSFDWGPQETDQETICGIIGKIRERYAAAPKVRADAEAVAKMILEWLDKQGHDRCWYYPEILIEIARYVGIEEVRMRPITDMPRAEFERGCRKFQDEQYGAGTAASGGEQRT